MLGWNRRIRIRQREVGKAAGPRLCRLIDTIPDHAAVAAVDDQRKERVHDVVVEAASATRLVLAGRAVGNLDLQEATALLVRLSGVDDKEVGEEEIRQGVLSVAVRFPVRLPVEAVPEP